MSQFGSNPVGQPSFPVTQQPPSSAGEFFDVAVAAGSSFPSVTVSDCNLGGGTTLEWLNDTTWVPVSPQTYSAGPPACATTTPGSNTSPTIAQLTGTVFAVTLSGKATARNFTVRGSSGSVPIRCTGGSRSTCKVTLTLTVTEKIKGGKVIAVAATNHNSKKTTAKVVVVGTTRFTLAAGQSKTVRVSLNGAGKSLLASYEKLKVELTITQSDSTAASQTITFKAKPKKR
ncbi:MAG: hypothetical protein ACLP0J_19850 [Solirubrobacteraceae bacterium]